MDSILNILEYWNSKQIIKHSKLTDPIKKAIEKALKIYSEEEIKTYIERYNIIIKDKNYFYSYKWKLVDFLNRKNGISEFADDGSKWVNYNDAKKTKTNFEQRNYSEDELNNVYDNIEDVDL